METYEDEAYLKSLILKPQ